MSSSSQFDHDRFRILLYRRDGNELLLDHDDEGFTLPSIQTPRYTRVAQQITQAIRKDWKLQTYCLLPIVDRHSLACAVELCGAVSAHPPNTNWLPVDSLAERDFSEARDFQTIDTAAKLFDPCRNRETAGPFAKHGWLRDVAGWVESKAVPLGLHLTGEFQQFNASATFSLIRFGTNGPAVWFKAVGAPNLREFRVSRELDRFFPGFVPTVLAVREDWNAWLTFEADGVHPDEHSGVGTWTAAGRRLAELQIASIGSALHLIEAGCRDARIPALRDLVDPFLHAMAALMERQVKHTPPPLRHSELRALRRQLRDALVALEESAIPDTLGHLDLNSGNVLVSTDRCVFLDWAEACVSHPFITFQYLLERVRRRSSHGSRSDHEVVSNYVAAWRSLLAPDKMIQALTFAPLVAVFAHAAGGGSWSQTQRSHDSRTPAYLRGLTRRMKREAERLAVQRIDRSVECLG
jgi:hypothetical protein